MRNSLSWEQWYETPRFFPPSCKVDTTLAQIYEISNFLTTQECQDLIHAINGNLVPSTVTIGSSDYRTSRTCHFSKEDMPLVSRIDQKLADLLSVDPRLSEPLQGQRYDPGQYFKEHTDWFAPGTEEFVTHTNPGGQRTWTVMVYLNDVTQGGQTCFQYLDRCFTPTRGLALAWNNLKKDGSPNSLTLHEAMPVKEGNKWVITKWFRAEPGRV